MTYYQGTAAIFKEIPKSPFYRTRLLEVTVCEPKKCKYNEGPVFWAWDRSLGAWVHYHPNW